MNNPLDISGASSEALRHCATVVNFTTSRWYDSRKDDRISDAGAHTTGADPAAVTSHKKLLGTRRSEYLAVSREVSRAEKIHEKLGQPYRHALYRRASGRHTQLSLPEPGGRWTPDQPQGRLWYG